MENPRAGNSLLPFQCSGGRLRGPFREWMTLAAIDAGGTDNTALGMETMFTNVSGNYNTAVGFKALLNSTGDSNIAIGTNAGIDDYDMNRAGREERGRLVDGVSAVVKRKRGDVVRDVN